MITVQSKFKEIRSFFSVSVFGLRAWAPAAWTRLLSRQCSYRILKLAVFPSPGDAFLFFPFKVGGALGKCPIPVTNKETL